MIKCRLFVPPINALLHYQLIMGCNDIAGYWATEKQKMAIDQLAVVIDGKPLDKWSMCQVINIGMGIVEAPPSADDPIDALEELNTLTISVSD